MKKFVIIGDFESIVFYKALGWEVVYVNLEDKKSVLESFDETVKKKEFERIFVVEDVYEILEKEYPNFEKLNISLIPLPGIKGSKNIAKKKYKKLSSIATGVKIE